MTSTTGKCCTMTSYGLLIMRVMLGAVLMYHGSQKLFGAFGGHGIEGFATYLEGLKIPQPQISAWMAAIAEFGGGACILLGMMTRFAAVPVAISMAVAYFVGHGGKFDGQSGGGEYAMTLGVFAIGFILTGAGGVSLDAMFCKPKAA